MDIHPFNGERLEGAVYGADRMGRVAGVPIVNCGTLGQE